MTDTSTKDIVIYSTPTCHFCHMAKNFFKEHGFEFTDYNVAEDPERRKEVVEKSGQMGVPVIIISDDKGERIIVGFDKQQITDVLGVAA